METINQADHLAAIQQLVMQFSDRLQARFIPAMEERLALMATDATSDEEQWYCLRLTAQIRNQRNSLLNGFRQYLAAGFQRFSEGTLGGQDTSREDASFDLALLASDDREQDIATLSLSRRVETRFNDLLQALGHRLAIVRGGRKLPDDGNPLGSGQFANALHAEISLLQLDAPHAVIFYRVFEQLLLENLGDLYHAVNDYLIQQGILPNLRIRSRSVLASGQSAGEDERSGAAGPDSDAMQCALYRAICEVQQQKPAAVIPPVAACSKEDVVLALANVRVGHHADALEQPAVPPSMTLEHFRAVTVHLHEHIGDEKHFCEEFTRLVDLVGMVFEFMLGDPDLPDSVKAVLSYLHTPYLKTVFADHTLLAEPQHPARQLLNLLADIGGRRVNDDGESQFKVFPKIKAVVRQVLTESRHDSAMFADLLAEMQEFSQKVERNIGVVERRACEKAEGEDRLRTVKSRVLREILLRMQGHGLPAVAVVLLLNPWADYLTFSLLRYGEDSRHWQEGLETVNDIIWSVQAKADQAERNRLIVLQAALQERIQAGLETVAHDQARSRKLLDTLHEAQMLTLQNLVAAPVDPQKRAQMEADVMAGLEQATVTAAQQQLLQAVQCGTRMEFSAPLDRHRNLRVHVAWCNADSAHYLLVDRSGKEIAVMHGAQLADLLAVGDLRVLNLSDKPFFERALGNVLARLQATALH